MGIYLEKIEIKRFRGIEKYTIDNFGVWTSITGPNSTNKSSIISAISLLGSNRMHEISDIPSWYKPSEVNPLEVPIEITYQFKLNKSFDKLMSDSRIVETLTSMYEMQLKDYPKKDSKDSIIKYLENALIELKMKTPLGKILDNALYKTIRHEIERYPDYEPYKPLFYSNSHFKMPEVIFNEAKILQISLSMTTSHGPEFDFSLLDDQKKPIVVNEVFSHWLDHQNAIFSNITWAYVIGAIFIKSVINIPINKSESNIPPTTLDLDGSNIKQYIEYCLIHHPDILKNVNSNYKRIFGQGVEFKVGSAGNAIEENEIIIKIEESNEWFSIDKLSDGMFHVLRILLQLASCNKGDIILIDEPELHLHPGATKCLKDILVEKKSEIQIICATHSPIFIDPSVVDIVILNQNIDNTIKPRLLNANTIDMALAELGSSGLDLLLFDAIIWVEGPSDKIYLERWMKLLLNKFGGLPISQIGFLTYGGKSMLSHLNIEEIKSINRNSFFVMDSDKKSENDEIDSLVQDFTLKCNKSDIFCWITNRRAIENYIPINILEKILNLESNTLDVSKYDDVIDELKKVGRNFEERKVKLAKTISPTITLEHIENDKEFYKELKNFIVKIDTDIQPD